MRLFHATLATPLGDMLALASAEGLCALEFMEPNMDTRLARLAARLERWAAIRPPTRRSQVRDESGGGPYGGPSRAKRGERRQKPVEGEETDAHALSWFPPHEIVERESGALSRTRQWLDAYFAGASAASADLPIDMHGAPFERRVWRALLEIPPGETTSYGAIAKALGSAAASRAVGAANGANPIAIVVPCHRVIGASGSLVGYGGGLDRKTWLLNHERRWRSDSLF
jgi:O-6-methylguanine DNA methyltransferase